MSSQAPSLDADSIDEALDNVNSVLLLSPDHIHEEEICSRLLSVVSPEETRYMSVTLDGSADDRIDAWRANIGELPAETGIISVGEATRSATSTRSQGLGSSPVTIDSVNDASDLTGLAMAIGGYIDAWSETEETPVFCFDSLTSLLYHADEERIFRLIHATNGRLRELGTILHYHLDPTANDKSTINRFAALFDAIVEVEEDGSVSVRKRRFQ